MLARENFEGPYVCLRRAQSSGTTEEYFRMIADNLLYEFRFDQVADLAYRRLQ